MRVVMVLSLLLLLPACVTEVTSTTRATDMRWPTSDEPLSSAQRTEVEAILGQLGYAPGAVDGNITTTSRRAITSYKAAIGAPENGVISAVLLGSLRASLRASGRAPVRVVPRPAAASPRDSDSDGNGGGGGGGGGWG